MKCPFCGKRIEWEIIKYKQKAAPAATLFCPDGCFISGEGSPSRCLAELESAYNWNLGKSKGGDE